MFKKVISLALSVVFSLQTCGFAQVGQLNLARYLGQGGGAPALDRFRPASLRYLSYEPDSDNFRILLDKADEKDLSNIQIKDKADELMRYFRIGLSLPNDKFWVNLRPDAPEQIIDSALEQTDIGKIMLEADLQLKKDTSSLTSPQTKEGKEYWDKLYKKAGELFGTENITIPTITRPWIVPGEIIVRESGNSAYIYKAALKVMLEEDYLNNQKTEKPKNQKTDYNFPDPRMKELNKYSTRLIRELIIPQLTKEVNRARRYAGLRQVYYSLILARWFKQNYHNSGASEHQGASAPVNENNTLVKLVDSGSLDHLTSREPWSKDTYYQRYKKSFEQGEYNLSETVQTPTGQLIRRYVSGGISAGSALKVDDHFDVGKVNKGIPGVGDIFISSGSKPVVRAAASALNSRQKENKELVSAIVYIAERFSKLTVFGDISLHESGAMMGMGVSSLFNDSAFRLGLAEIGKKISEYKKRDSWSIKFNKDSTFEQIKKRLLEEVGISVSSALTADNEISGRLKDWEIFKSIEVLVLNQPAVSFETNVLIGKKVYTIIKASKQSQGDEYWTIELLENAESKDPAAQIRVYGNGAIEAMTLKSLSDTERDLIVAKVLRHFFRDKSQRDALLKETLIKIIKNIRLADQDSLGEKIRPKYLYLQSDEFQSSVSKAKGPVFLKELVVRVREIIEEIKKGTLYRETKDNLINKDKEITAFVKLLNAEILSLIADKITEGFNQGSLNYESLNKIVTRDDYERIIKIQGGLKVGDIVYSWRIEIINTINNIDEKLVHISVFSNKMGIPYHMIRTEFYQNGSVNTRIEFGVDAQEKIIKALSEVSQNDWSNLAKTIEQVLTSASSAVVTKGAAPEDIGAVDFRAMDMLIQPQGSFKGLDFSPVSLSGPALEAMDLEKDLEGINQMTLGRRRPHPQRLKEYVSACIFKEKIDEKGDDFILSMLEVFQLQAEEGIESASQDREAVVLADTRGYVKPEKRLAASNSYRLN